MTSYGKEDLMEKIPRLTELEMLIMGALWDNEKDMTIQEIAENLKEHHLSPASVTQAINRMVKKAAVEVSDHIPVSNVYARTFHPCISREAFAGAEIRRLEKKIAPKKRLSVNGLMAALLQNDTGKPVSRQELDELQALIDHLKSEESDH